MFEHRVMVLSLKFNVAWWLFKNGFPRYISNVGLSKTVKVVENLWLLMRMGRVIVPLVNTSVWLATLQAEGFFLKLFLYCTGSESTM